LLLLVIVLLWLLGSRLLLLVIVLLRLLGSRLLLLLVFVLLLVLRVRPCAYRKHQHANKCYHQGYPIQDSRSHFIPP
jgi:hypothetical protein